MEAKKFPITKIPNKYCILLVLNDSERKNINGKSKRVNFTSRSNHAECLLAEYNKPVTCNRKKDIPRIKKGFLIATLKVLNHSPVNNHEIINNTIEITDNLRENGIKKATSKAL